MKRFLSLLLSFALVLSLVIPVSSFAVPPIALAEAALASFVASTGYKMYIDNGTGSDLTAMVSQLYDTYLHTHPEAMTLSVLLQGNYIFVDDLANIIVTQQAATWFQDFCNWIKTEYAVAVGGSQSIVISTGDGVFDSNGVQSYKYDCTYPVVINGVTWYYSEIITGYYAFGGTNFPSYLIASTPASLYATFYEANSGSRNYFAITSDSPTSCSVNFFSESASGAKVKIISDITVSSGSWSVTGVSSTAHYDDALLVSNVNPSNVSPSSLTTDSSTGLAVSLANDVADKLGDIVANNSAVTNPTQESVMVINVGADPAVAGEDGLAPDASAADIKVATEQNVIDSVVDIYNPATGELPVQDSIVSAEIVDTPVQPYPDVDSLGLPELGLALTSRFPFCIPWDIASIYSSISRPAEAPYVQFSLIPSSVLSRWGISADTTITIDFREEKYSVLITILHWSCIIGFCFGLAVMTKRYVWTTGG